MQIPDKPLPDNKTAFSSFDVPALAAEFPDTAQTLLLDRYLVDRADASARLFRVYRGTPPHYHVHSDEFLYVLSGRGTFWMGDAANKAEFGPGTLLFFERGTVHALPDILQPPVVFLSFDAPRREPADIVFVDPADGTPDSFISRQK